MQCSTGQGCSRLGPNSTLCYHCSASSNDDETKTSCTLENATADMLHHGVYCSHHCCSPNAVAASFDDTHGGGAHGGGVDRSCFNGVGKECDMIIIDFIVRYSCDSVAYELAKVELQIRSTKYKIGGTDGGTEWTLL